MDYANRCREYYTSITNNCPGFAGRDEFCPFTIDVGDATRAAIGQSGRDFSGVVGMLGNGVSDLKVGDPVFGVVEATGEACYAEKVAIKSSIVAKKPDSLTHVEAAALALIGLTAIVSVEDTLKLKAGETILVQGGAGGVAGFAVQLAKHYGAEVTAVDSTAKLDMLRSIGADQVIDYTQEDFTERDEIYDVIFDVVGVISFSRTDKSLKQNGVYLLANPGAQMVQALWTRMTTKKQVIMQTASGTIGDLDFLRALIEEGKIRTVIDRSYPLEQIAEAHRYVEKGHKKGNVVIIVK